MTSTRRPRPADFGLDEVPTQDEVTAEITTMLGEMALARIMDRRAQDYRQALHNWRWANGWER